VQSTSNQTTTQFLAERTNGRAYNATVSTVYIASVVVCLQRLNVIYCG